MKFLLFILVIIDNLSVFLANNDNCGVNDLNALMARLLQLRTEFNNFKIQHDEQIAVLKEEINNKETELKELRQDVNNKTLEIAAISKDIEMIKDIDDCSPNQCQNGATCVDGVTSYTCSCVAGYNGTLCEIDIDGCNPNPCQNGATCTDGVDSYTCTCVAGYTGTNCETDIDGCNPNPCQNGATCTDGVDSYMCTCVAGYTGTNCETEKCPANWYFFQESCYYYSIKGLEWLKAKKDCVALGGHLIEITSEPENYFITSIIRYHVWIGLNDIVTEGVYVWVSNENNASDVYTNWNSGQPDNQTNQNCVLMDNSKGYWYDDYCSAAWPFICEKLPD